LDGIASPQAANLRRCDDRSGLKLDNFSSASEEPTSPDSRAALKAGRWSGTPDLLALKSSIAIRKQ